MIYHNIATPDEIDLAKELNLLTAKKFIYVINVSEEQLLSKWRPDEKLIEVIGNSPFVVMNNKLELTLSEMPVEERRELMLEFGLSRLEESRVPASQNKTGTPTTLYKTP